MLSLEALTLETVDSDPPRPLLDDVSLRMRRGQLVGVIGPSGCGKSTLLKLIAGLSEPTGGTVSWDGRDLATEGDLPPHELGYVPQFSNFHGLLTVRECVDYAARLRVADPDPAARAARVDALLATTGLADLADRQARLLSGGQRRRLALAVEMVSSPSLLLCDEVTSGLDPGSAHDILTLLYDLSRADGGDRRVVVNVTHSLADLHLYDLILVLFEGVVVFHGPPDYLAHYFRLDSPDEVFSCLGTRQADQWRDSWRKHGPHFTALAGLDAYPDLAATDAEPDPTFANVDFASATPAEEEDHDAPPPGPFADLLAANAAYEAAAKRRRDEPSPATDEQDPAPDAPPLDESTEGEELPPADPDTDAAPDADPDADEAAAEVTPSAFTQFQVVLERRLLLFMRDRTQLGLQIALILGFPCLVVIFALEGLPAIRNLSLARDVSIVDQLRESATYLAQSFEIGGLVSGLLLFQIILLALMGSNNSALEIAGERGAFESEKLAGLSPASYVGAKCAFLALLVTAQSVWMVLFVHLVCGFPGDILGKSACSGWPTRRSRRFAWRFRVSRARPRRHPLSRSTSSASSYRFRVRCWRCRAGSRT